MPHNVPDLAGVSNVPSRPTYGFNYMPYSHDDSPPISVVGPDDPPPLLLHADLSVGNEMSGISPWVSFTALDGHDDMESSEDHVSGLANNDDLLTHMDEALNVAGSSSGSRGTSSGGSTTSSEDADEGPEIDFENMDTVFPLSSSDAEGSSIEEDNSNASDAPDALLVGNVEAAFSDDVMSGVEETVGLTGMALPLTFQSMLLTVLVTPAHRSAGATASAGDDLMDEESSSPDHTEDSRTDSDQSVVSMGDVEHQFTLEPDADNSLSSDREPPVARNVGAGAHHITNTHTSSSQLHVPAAVQSRTPKRKRRPSHTSDADISSASHSQRRAGSDAQPTDTDEDESSAADDTMGEPTRGPYTAADFAKYHDPESYHDSD
ncbi:hypothetical protein NP233_g12355 [Leucocoprinus birnbaumii]|uniref:Uncharacterized protein n=1 Tax=Leucocoprinus birnbaumii TaxID=56174 RepID=A0AAD5YQ40_9AGAR|nr:hypothetical protein NP233_g12355 [Leucocoprinus birnbaumii]